ncbi:MAG: thioredoxin domain-containing protein [Spirochaetes bacterium]|nr:thioredoxin domain-containing protein [Spirochaetota bacterium]
MNHLADEKSPYLLQHASNPVGWPLTIVMTPDGNPFFAATYIPKENAYRRSGMLELVPRIAELWKNRRADILSSADSIGEELLEAARAGVSGIGSASAAAPEAAMVGQASAGLAGMFDAKNGGFGAAPKFPMPTVFTLLLRSWKRNGGVYDQALLAFAYTETWQATSGDFYERTARARRAASPCGRQTRYAPFSRPRTLSSSSERAVSIRSRMTSE